MTEREFKIKTETNAIVDPKTTDDCQTIASIRLRTTCFAKLNEIRQQEVQRQILQQEVAETKKTTEPELKLKKCEGKKTLLDRAKCYNEYQTDQRERKQKYYKSEAQKKTERIINASPTLLRMQCQKISNRTERNDCFVELRQTLKEQERQKRRARIQDFDYNTESRRCLQIGNKRAQTECFEDLDRVAEDVYNAQDRQFDPTAND